MDVENLFDVAEAKLTPFDLLKHNLYSTFNNLAEQGYPEVPMLALVMDMQARADAASPMLTQAIYSMWKEEKEEAHK